VRAGSARRIGELDLRERFQEIVDQNYDGLWSYLSALTGGAADAHDLTHQAFLIAFDRLAAGKEFTGDTGKWLRGVARNLVFSWWRQRRKLPEELAHQLCLAAEEAEDALAELSRAEAAEALKRCMEKLSEGERELVRGRYELGLRNTQLAERLRVSVASVRVRLFRIRQGLRTCLETQLGKGNVL
jgi:RNA polymerase sigma-70 factor (ECF subfamily)